MKKETLRTILIIVGVLVLLCIVGLGSVVWLFMRSFEAGKADQAMATQQFDGIRARFAGVTPVLDVRDGEPVIARRPPAAATGPRLSTMHVIAWDPDDDDLVRIDLPFWLLRLKSGPIEIASDHTWMSDNNLGITVEELERFGSTLILDQETRDGGRVLIWTE